MDIEKEELAKKFYLESDIEGIHFTETNEVRLNYLDLLKLMNGFAEQQVKNNGVLDDVMTELPDFLYNDDGIIRIGFHGESDATKEWKDFIKKLGYSL